MNNQCKREMFAFIATLTLFTRLYHFICRPSNSTNNGTEKAGKENKTSNNMKMYAKPTAEENARCKVKIFPERWLRKHQ